ncbi:MAG: hypothetical protein ABFS18_07090 [Thermodesulfobacteriota bacterium]
MTIFRVILATLVVVLGILSRPVFSGESSVSFSWAFFLKPEGGPVESLDFETEEPVSGGELLRIYLELHVHSFVYLYLFDSREDLYLVFPPNGSFYNGEIPDDYKFYIPSGHEWFALDNLKGTERFYLLASSKRLIELEKLTDRFLATGGNILKLQLQEKIDGVAGKFAGASVYEIEQVPVQHGEWLSTSNLPPPVSARKISTTGVYGVVLDMVNK